MTLDDFLEARVRGDQDLHAADREAKLQIIELFRLAGSTFDIHRDAWLMLRATLCQLAIRYAEHPDHDSRWSTPNFTLCPPGHSVAII